ncbi:MAG: hypothetical protein P1U56_05775 [Saprospiraceae bacterium]|nr:hypothetical protein [Saprospiraceae bacterium]
MKKSILFLLLVIILGACSAPKYLSSPEDFKNQVKGLTLKVELEDSYRLKGEIIEVNSTGVVVLPQRLNNRTLTTIPKSALLGAKVLISTTSNDPRGISSWAAAVNLITLGHGVFAVITLPANLLVTVPVGNGAASATYQMKYPEDVSYEQLHKFARFPQGIPEGIDLSKIY